MNSDNRILERYKNEKFDIIILAGQSNAWGCGIGPSEEDYAASERVLWLCDDAPIGFKRDEHGEDYLFVPEECSKTMRIASEEEENGGKKGNFALFFAKRYIEDGRLGEGRKLLIINSSIGGTGFAKKQWGLGAPLYERLCDMTEQALGMNPENRVVALLWHQGEHDAFENAYLTPSERHDFYLSSVSSMMEDYFSRFALRGVPVIAGEFCSEWYRKNKETCDAVLAATRDFLGSVGGELASSEGLLSNNEKNGNGDDIHFCRDSLRELGYRYYEKFKVIVSA